MTDPDGICRWGFVGLGWVARDFLMPAVRASRRSRVVACVGSSPAKSEAFAREFGIARPHATLGEMLRDEAVNAVYVALPNAMHRDAVSAAAEAGKHVLCEKPMALSVADAAAMVEDCASAGVLLRVAHQIRLDAAIGRAREIVRSGRLGRLASLTLDRASGLPERQPWREDVRQSGVVFDVGVHLLDLARWITGQEFAEVAAFTHPDRRDGIPDDTVTILGRLDGGCHASIRATREVASAQNALVVEGSRATLIAGPLRFAAEHVVRVRGHDGEETVDRFPASPAYALEVEAFESELAGLGSVLPDGGDALATVRVTAAVLEAVETRRIVTVS